MTGNIFNIQKFSLHDGSGIRTCVFFKGCPLNCTWCHNPESQYNKSEIMFHQEKCISCFKCISVCEFEAVNKINGNIVYNRDNCIKCMKCVNICNQNALEMIGRDYTSDSLIKEIMKDRIFFEESNGGVTFTGGEPLFQSEFLSEILARCKEEDINTAIETSCFCEIEDIKKVIDYIDYFFIDIKIMNNKKHKEMTGVENSKIFQNISYIADKKKQILIRLPLIPSINDDYENISSMADFMNGIGLKNVEILGYHKIGTFKYNKLWYDYKLKEIAEPDKELLEKIKSYFEEKNINAFYRGEFI